MAILTTAIPQDRLLMLGGLQQNWSLTGSWKGAAWTWFAPQAGNVTDIVLQINGVATSQPARVGLQTVNVNGATPNGTWLGSTNQAYVNLASVSPGILRCTLNETAAVNVGQRYWVIFEYQSTIGNISVVRGTTISVSTPNPGLFPFTEAMHATMLLHNGAAWGTPIFHGIPCVCCVMDTASSWNPGVVLPISSQQLRASFSTALSNYEYGNVVPLKAGMVVTGVQYWGDINSFGEFRLYDTDHSTVLASTPIAAGWLYSTTYNQWHQPLNAHVTIPADGNYLVSFRATTTNTSYTYIKNVFPSYLNTARHCGTDAYTAYRGAGAWTYETDSQIGIAAVVNVPEPGGGGGGGGVSRSRIFGGY